MNCFLADSGFFPVVSFYSSKINYDFDRQRGHNDWFLFLIDGGYFADNVVANDGGKGVGGVDVVT